jgi:protoheme IX farnesyltransferase
MSTSDLELTNTQTVETSSRWAAFWELTKPRISAMVLISIVVSGLVAASGSPGLWPLFHVAVGMFLVAASGNAMNMYLERYTDPLMARTARRPLPDRRLSALDVMNFGAITFGAGVSYLLTTLNWQTALCAVVTWVLYVLVYTPMKTRTWLNTEVGAVAGALPIFSGALATTGTLNWQAWGFFLVLLFWQFPHFMAIAWLYREQYANGGLKMLTVVDPSGLRAAGQSLAAALAMVPASLVLAVPSGSIRLFLAAAVASIVDGVAAARFAVRRDDASARALLFTSLGSLLGLLTAAVAFGRPV